jgi:hypothetical protein
MITEITKEQEALMPEYVKKWIDIGTSTDRLDYDNTSEVVNEFRKLIDMNEVPLVIVNNPIEAWVTCSLFEQGVAIDDLYEKTKYVFDNPMACGYNIEAPSLPYQTGSFFASVFSSYDYFLNVLGVKLEPELFEKYQVWQKTCEIGCIYPLEGLTVVCQKPTIVKLNENNVLHSDGSPSLEYDGFGDFKVWSLNGVDVPQWLAETPAQHIDIERYSEIENADVKAEFVRKVGIERFLDKGKKMDTYENYDQEENPWWWKSEYELVDMAAMFESLDSAPYLKMVNQTTGIFHLDGVSPSCTTLAAAIKERFGGRDMKIVNIA